ncbi:MAG: hypothetical protein K1X85_10640 [Ignavibacteria bacterium]|nr:hypothetical protein [Ignavibacteria bacterium]
MYPSDRIRFQNLSIDDGLSQSAVMCILQDSLGFIWLGTQDGLNRYDGRKFVIYKSDNTSDDSISSNLIYSLFEDSEGNVWIGTLSGLCRYDRKLDRFEQFLSSGRSKEFPVDQIRSIAEGRDGRIYLATYGGGLSVFDVHNRSFKTYGEGSNPNGLSYAKLNSLLVDSNGRIFVGTWGGGVNIFDPGSERFLRIAFKDTNENSLSHKRVNNLTEDHSGNILISTNGGLFILEKDRAEAVQAELPELIKEQEAQLISFAKEDSHRNLWIGTREKGLWLRRKESGRFVNYAHDEFASESISNNSVTCIFEDMSGLIWVGTYGDGADRFSPETGNILHFFHDPRDHTSISTNKVYCFAEAPDGRIWIGTRGKGVNVLDMSTYEVKQFEHPEFDQRITGLEVILSIETDPEGSVWIGTSGGGLIRYDPFTGEMSHFRQSATDERGLSNDTVYDILSDEYGNLWIGTSGGLNYYDKKRNSFRSFRSDPDDPATLSSDRIRDLCFGDDGRLWIATEYGGLNSMDTKSMKIRRHYGAGGVNIDKVVYSLAVTADGCVWAGTTSGIYILNEKKRTCRAINEKDGLPNNLIYSIIPDNDSIWISTNNGIARLSMTGEVISTYDKSDGFQGNEFIQHSSLKLRDGRIMYGGLNGINLFDPNGFKKSGFRPKLVFTDFRLFNRSVVPGIKDSPLESSVWSEKEIELTYRDSVITFGFAAMDFRAPGKIQYRYKLEKFDRDWVSSGNAGTATYTNLDHGQYTFRVMCTNCEGEWNEDILSMGISISPPFWKTGWFKALSAVSVLTAGSMIYQNKLNQVRKEKKAQEEFTRKVIEAQENDRKRIASELHDSIGHGLLISKNRLQLSLNEGTMDGDTSEKLKDVSEILSGTLSEVREISYNLHPYQIERLGLTKAIKSIVDRVSGTAGVSFTSSVDEIDGLLPQDSEITLYRIVQESVNNIIKHSHATEALLNVSRGECDISVLISDNGAGFPSSADKQSAPGHGLGLQGMKERARMMNAGISITSSRGSGTEVKLSIPIDLKEACKGNDSNESN